MEGFGIKSVAFSRDGKYILAGGTGYAAFLWDAQTGALLQCFVGHMRTVESVKFSPDGKTVLTSAWDHRARLWDANTSALLYTWSDDTAHEASPDVAYSPDGTMVFTMAGDGTENLWDVQTGVKLHSLSEPEDDSLFLVYAFSPDSRLLVTTNSAYDIARIWDMHSGTLLHTLQGDVPDTGNPNTGMFSVAWSPDGKTILTGDQEVIKWDVQTGTRLQAWQVFKTIPRTINGTDIGIQSIEYFPDGKTVMTDGDDGPIVWDAASGRRLRVLKNIKYPGLMSPDGRTLALSDYGKVTLWDAESGMLLRTLTLQPPHPPSLDQPYLVNSLAFSPDSKTLVTGSQDDLTRVWDVQSGKLLLTLESPIPGFPME